MPRQRGERGGGILADRGEGAPRRLVGLLGLAGAVAGDHAVERAQHLLLLLARRLHRLGGLGDAPRDEAQPPGAEGEVEIDQEADHVVARAAAR